MYLKTIKEDAPNQMTLTIEDGLAPMRYIVKLRNKDKEYAARCFYSLSEAYKVYEKLARWIVFGLHTQQEMFQYLLNRIIDEEKEKKTCQDAEPVDRK